MSNDSLDKMKNDKDEVFYLINNTAALSQETAASSEEFASSIAYYMQTIGDIFSAVQETGKN